MGAKPPVRCGHDTQRGQIRGAVQHHPAAAIHLQINKTGRQDAACKRMCLGALWQLGLWHDVGRAAGIDHQRMIDQQRLAVENTGSGIGDHG